MVVMHKRQIVLAGERIALGEMLEADQPQFYVWLSRQPDLRSMIDDPRIPTQEDQSRWFQRSKEADRKMFSLVTVPEGALIGHAGFVDIDQAKRTAQFRITIGDPAARGRGYGREATDLLLRYAADALQLASVWLRVRQDNAAALSLYARTGFTIKEEYPATGDRAAGMIMEKLCR